jgi:hypothetical protein
VQHHAVAGGGGGGSSAAYRADDERQLALQQAQAEGMALREADNWAGNAEVTVLPSEEALQRARDVTIGAVALEIIYQAAEAAAIKLGVEVAAEVMAGIALGL